MIELNINFSENFAAAFSATLLIAYIATLYYRWSLKK